jgi:hypothetical protein
MLVNYAKGDAVKEWGTCNAMLNHISLNNSDKHNAKEIRVR